MSNKMDRHLVTVDGRTLMDRPLEPPNFVVDTLISQGLHILAGSPKVGKSWLALWLAVTVAKGEPVWGMSVKQGTTLYLCLEDSVLRIQNRLFEITEDAPDSVHFCTECAPIGQGLEEQVEGFLVAHPDTVLVLVDTLQMVRPVHDATYANDYRDLSVLKRLADKHGIAILLIHHLRKETADDVFNRSPVARRLIEHEDKIRVFKDILHFAGSKQILDVLRNGCGYAAPFSETLPDFNGIGGGLFLFQEKMKFVHKIPGGFPFCPVDGDAVPYLVLHNEHT